MNYEDTKMYMAFPVSSAEGEYWQQGMTLRDYFAAKSMAVIFTALANDSFEANAKDGETPASSIARNAYEMADAMMKAREE